MYIPRSVGEDLLIALVAGFRQKRTTQLAIEYLLIVDTRDIARRPTVTHLSILEILMSYV